MQPIMEEAKKKKGQKQKLKTLVLTNTMPMEKLYQQKNPLSKVNLPLDTSDETSQISGFVRQTGSQSKLQTHNQSQESKIQELREKTEKVDLFSNVPIFDEPPLAFKKIDGWKALNHFITSPFKQDKLEFLKYLESATDKKNQDKSSLEAQMKEAGRKPFYFVKMNQKEIKQAFPQRCKTTMRAMDVTTYEKQNTLYDFKSNLGGIESPKKGLKTQITNFMNMQKASAMNNYSMSEIKTETSRSLNSNKKQAHQDRKLQRIFRKIARHDNYLLHKQLFHNQRMKKLKLEVEEREKDREAILKTQSSENFTRIQSGVKDLQDVLRSSSDSRKNVQFKEMITEKDEEIVGDIIRIEEIVQDKVRPKSGRVGKIKAFKPSRTFISKDRVQSGLNYTSTQESRNKIEFNSTLYSSTRGEKISDIILQEKAKNSLIAKAMLEEKKITTNNKHLRRFGSTQESRNDPIAIKQGSVDLESVKVALESRRSKASRSKALITSPGEASRFSRNKMQNSQRWLYQTNYAQSYRNQKESYVGAVEAKSFASYQKGKL